MYEDRIYKKSFYGNMQVKNESPFWIGNSNSIDIEFDEIEIVNWISINVILIKEKNNLDIFLLSFPFMFSSENLNESSVKCFLKIEKIENFLNLTNEEVLNDDVLIKVRFNLEY